VGEVLDELAAGALDSDNTRTNVHLDCRETKIRQSSLGSK
jgi:hypothetical protein